MIQGKQNVARALRLARVQQKYNAGYVTEREAKELLMRPLVPGDVSSLFDDSDRLIVVTPTDPRRQHTRDRRKTRPL